MPVVLRQPHARGFLVQVAAPADDVAAVGELAIGERAAPEFADEARVLRVDRAVHVDIEVGLVTDREHDGRGVGAVHGAVAVDNAGGEGLKLAVGVVATAVIDLTRGEPRADQAEVAVRQGAVQTCERRLVAQRGNVRFVSLGQIDT